MSEGFQTDPFVDPLSEETMSVSVIVPCHNESFTLSSTVEDVLAAWGERPGLELVLVDDASTDASYEVMCALSGSSHSPIRAIRREEQGGLGGALATGFESATGEVLTWLPADGEYNMADLLDAFDLLPEWDMILVRRSRRGQFMRGAVSLAMHALVVGLFRLDLRGYCGIFVIRQRDWLRLRVQGRSGFFTVEAAITAQKLGFALTWIQAEWSPREVGRSSVFRPRVLAKSLADLVALRWRFYRRLATTRLVR